MSLLLVVDSAVVDWTDDHLVLVSMLLVLNWTSYHPVLVALSHLMSDDHLNTNGAVSKSQCDATGLELPVDSE